MVTCLTVDTPACAVDHRLVSRWTHALSDETAVVQSDTGPSSYRRAGAGVTIAVRQTEICRVGGHHCQKQQRRAPA